MESKDEYIKILESQVRVQKAIVAKLKKKYNHVDNIIEDPTGQICDIVSNETPIQSPDADNTERGERPSIKDYFPESFGVMDILPIYESQPELFNYAKALDRYIDDIENPTPPTLLNELRENADKQAIEFAEWLIVNDVQEGEGLTSTYWMNYEPYTLQELLELFKQSKANKP